MNREQVAVYTRIYEKLINAIDANEEQTRPIAAVSVLGATGDWLSELSNKEIAELISQLSAELLLRTKE